MIKQPLVSVVIPTHNRLKYLKEAIASVKGQTFDNWELIIVDDCSSDGTWEWLLELKDPQVQVFRQNQQSFRSGACNRGLAEAVGEFIMFFDDDDRLRPNALANLVKSLIKNPDVVATVGARWKFNEGVYAIKIEHPIIPFKRIIWPELLAGWSAVSGQNLYRTTTIRKVSGFNQNLRRAQDRDLWLKVARLGSVVLIPAIALEYRVHPGQSLPKNIIEIRDSIFNAFIDQLPVEEQHRGKRIRESAHLSQEAESEYRKGNYKTAFICYLKAYRVAPELAFSPLTGPPLVRGIAKSLLRTAIRR